VFRARARYRPRSRVARPRSRLAALRSAPRRPRSRRPSTSLPTHTLRAPLASAPRSGALPPSLRRVRSLVRRRHFPRAAAPPPARSMCRPRSKLLISRGNSPRQRGEYRSRPARRDGAVHATDRRVPGLLRMSARAAARPTRDGRSASSLSARSPPAFCSFSTRSATRASRAP